MLHLQQNALRNNDLRGALKVLDELADDTDRNKWRFRRQIELTQGWINFVKTAHSGQMCSALLHLDRRHSQLSEPENDIDLLPATLRLASRSESMTTNCHSEAGSVGIGTGAGVDVAQRKSLLEVRWAK